MRRHFTFWHMSSCSKLLDQLTKMYQERKTLIEKRAHSIERTHTQPYYACSYTDTLLQQTGFCVCIAAGQSNNKPLCKNRTLTVWKIEEIEKEKNNKTSIVDRQVNWTLCCCTISIHKRKWTQIYIDNSCSASTILLIDGLKT